MTAVSLLMVGVTVVLTGLAAFASARSHAQPISSNAPASFTAADEDGRLVIYSGRSASLVRDLISKFEQQTGIDAEVKYAKTGPLASLIDQEGSRSPADVFFAQDPGGLGLLARRDRLRPLPVELLEKVPAEYRDPQGRWIGVTGRARTVSYSTERLSSGDLPESIFDLTDERWRGRVGWAPTNASFQAAVTAMRHELGEAETEQWLRDMIDNDVRVYPKNTPIIQAIADGEIDLGLTNHYYLYRFIEQHGSAFPVDNYMPAGRKGEKELGATMLVAGASIVKTTDRPETAARFIEFLLSDEAQQYFADSTYEYPLVDGQDSHEMVPALDELSLTRVNLNRLADLEETIDLLRRVGAMP